MQYILIIGVVAFLALMMLYGYSRGFLKIVFSLIASIVTILFASLLTIPVSGVIENSKVGELVKESIAELVEEADVVDVSTIDNLDLPDVILDPVKDGAEKAVGTIEEYVVEEVSRIVIKTATFLILTIIIYVAVCIVYGVLNVFTKLPIIHGANKWAGIAAGALQGLVYLWIASLVLSAFADKSWAQEAFRQINDNSFLSFLYNNNPLANIVSKIL